MPSGERGTSTLQRSQTMLSVQSQEKIRPQARLISEKAGGFMVRDPHSHGVRLESGRLEICCEGQRGAGG